VSYSLDVNVLIDATNRHSPHYDRASAFLSQCANRLETMVLSWITLYSFLRIATHPSILPSPLTPAEAETNVTRLLRRPQVRVLAEDEQSWQIYRELTGRLPVRGNLVPDAQLAALLLRHGVRRLYTRDRDFRKFEGLEVVDPLA
jgi:uncharacterized protein